MADDDISLGNNLSSSHRIERENDTRLVLAWNTRQFTLGGCTMLFFAVPLLGGGLVAALAGEGRRGLLAGGVIGVIGLVCLVLTGYLFGQSSARRGNRIVVDRPARQIRFDWVPKRGAVTVPFKDVARVERRSKYWRRTTSDSEYDATGPHFQTAESHALYLSTRSGDDIHVLTGPSPLVHRVGERLAQWCGVGFGTGGP